MALKLQEQPGTDFPSRPAFRGNLGVTLYKLARRELARQNPASARDYLRQAVPPLRAAWEQTPQNPTYGKFLRNSLSTLAKTLGRLGDRGGAAEVEAELVRLFSPRGDANEVRPPASMSQ